LAGSVDERTGDPSGVPRGIDVQPGHERLSTAGAPFIVDTDPPGRCPQRPFLSRAGLLSPVMASLLIEDDTHR
jgi:hypothetical protein